MRITDERDNGTLADRLARLAVLVILSGFWLVSSSIVQAQPATPPPRDIPGRGTPKLVPDGVQSSKKWVIPSGLSLDARERVQSFVTIQTGIEQTPPEKINWLETLPELHALLASESDTLVARRNALLPGGAAGDRLGVRTGGPRVGLKRAVTDLIVTLPAAGKQKWRQLYADTASARLREAMAHGDERALASVASVYVETVAGWRAAEQLGVRNLDAGRPAAAIRYLDRLRQSPDARRSREPRLSLTIAVAWMLLRREDQAGLVLAQLKNWLKENSEAITADSDSADSGDSESRSSGAIVRELVETPLSDLLTGMRASVPEGSAENQAAGNGVAEQWLQPAGSVTKVASVAPVTAAGRVLWRSFADGFAERATAADRAPFATPWADYDQEPYPQTPAQMAGMVELALRYLDRVDVEESRVGLPAGRPLIAGGLAVLRTLDRVRAVDIQTGSVVWESFQQDPAFAEQFNLRTAKQALNFPRSEIRSPVNQVQEALLLVRTRLDRTIGTLSSDGQRVYFVTGGGIASRATRFGMARLVEVIPRSSNTLRAVDLSTGRLVWEVGGASDAPRLPGAGRFFLGPPVCLKDGLYVVAEDDGQAILLRLDPATGATTWQQELGDVISPVINEALRRITGESPVAADGLLVCTTSSGQIYAIAPEEQRIVWAESYPSDIPPARRFPATMRMTAQPMNTELQDDWNRWRDTQAVASGGRLILAAVDSPVLTCLDLVTGEVLWKQPRRDGLFVATVYDGHVVVVGEYDVRSLDLRSGETQWTVPFVDRLPAGYGVRSGDVYHLPIAIVVPPGSPRHRQRAGSAETASREDGTVEKLLSDAVALLDAAAGREDSSVLPPVAELDGAVLSLDLTTGRVLAESPAPGGLRLGNFAAAGGRLISQSFDSVIGFESISEQQTRLARLIGQPASRTDSNSRSDQKPRSDGKPAVPAARLDRARLRLHNGDRGGMDDLLQALSELASLPESSNRRETAQLQRDAEMLLIGQILEMQKQGETLDARLFELLDRIPLEATSQLTMERVRIDSLLQAGQFAVAFRKLDALAETTRTSASGRRDQLTVTDGGITRPLHRWIGARLAAVYRDAALADDADAQIAEMEQVISDRLATARQAPAETRDARLDDWLNLFSWHARSTGIRMQRAIDQPAEKLPAVERLLAPLLASAQPQTAMRAQAVLTAAYVKAGRGAAAVAALHELERLALRSGTADDAVLLNGQSLSELRSQWASSEAVSAARAATEWPAGVPEQSVTDTEPVEHPRRFLVERLGDASAAFDGWIMELSTDGLSGIDADGRVQWTVPAADLPGFPDPARQRFRAVWLTGGSLFAVVINADMAVFDGSKLPPRKLWSQSLTASDPALLPFGQKSFEFGMLVSTYRLRSGSRALAAVDLLTPATFVWRSGNRLHVVDARSGELLWERPAPSGEGFVLGNDRLLVLAETAPAQSRVFETATGRLLATFELPERTFLVSASGATPVFVTPRNGQVEFFGLDVLTGESRWQFAHERSAMTLPFGSRLVTLNSQGKLQVRDLRDGTLIADLKTQPFKKSFRELQFHETPAGFVLFTWTPTTQFRSGLNRLNTVAREYAPVNGYACGVDLQQSRITWESQVSANFLPKPQPRNLPVLLLAGSHTRKLDGISLRKPRCEVTAIDVRTGQAVARFSSDEPFRNADARRLAVADRSVLKLEIVMSGSKQPASITLDYSSHQ